MEAPFIAYAFAFALGAAVATFTAFHFVVDKWKAIAQKWKGIAAQETERTDRSRKRFNIAASITLDHLDAVVRIAETWNRYKEEAVNAPIPESPIDKLGRIEQADRSIRKAINALHEAARRNAAKAGSLSVPQGAPESGAVCPEERSGEGRIG